MLVFNMGKGAAVSFEEYDLFATATGRKLPDDTDWGDDKRLGPRPASGDQRVVGRCPGICKLAI